MRVLVNPRGKVTFVDLITSDGLTELRRDYDKSQRSRIIFVTRKTGFPRKLSNDEASKIF